MGFINATQFARDHSGMRNICTADGHPGTEADPLVKSTEGSRIHQSHTTDLRSGFYDQQQKD